MNLLYLCPFFFTASIALETNSQIPPKNKPRYTVVSQPSSRPGYAKIQDAIDAARSEGASSKHPAVIAVEAGRYEEDLRLYDGIEIQGPDGESIDFHREDHPFVQIAGKHTLPQEGAIHLKNLTLEIARSDSGPHLGFERTPKLIIPPATERTNPAATNSGSSTNITANLHSVLIGGADNSIVSSPVASNGQILIGSNGADPVWATPTDTGSIVWTTGPGTLSAEVVGGGFVASVVGTANRIDVSTVMSVATVNISPSYVGQGSITTLGTVSTGTWNGTVISPQYGGTGVNNGTKTLTLAGNLATVGAFNSTFTMTGATSVTFPTSGTLATTSQLPAPAALTAGNDTNVTLTLGGTPATALLQAASITAGWTGTLSPTRGGTGVNNGTNTLTLAGNLATSGAFASTFTMTGATSVTFPTSGTLATTTNLGSYLPLAGGTMTGNITFNGSTPIGLSFTGATGNNQITVSSAQAAALNVTDTTNTYLNINSTAARPRTILPLESTITGPLTMNGGYCINWTGAVYNSSGALSASQSGTTVTGSGTNFPPTCVGGMIYWPSTQQAAVIQSRDSATQLTVDVSQTQASAPFIIYYGGLNIDYAGVRQLQGQSLWTNFLDSPPSAVGYGTTISIGSTNATSVSIVPSLSLTTPLSPSSGGTGVNNGTNTLTLAGNLATSGAFASTFTMTNTTAVTFPTSGTLATTSQIPTGAALTAGNDTNVTLTLGGSPTTALVNAASVTAGWTGTLSPTRGGTGVNNGTNTLTLAGNLATSGAFASTFTMTNTTAVTFPTSGTLATTSQIPALPLSLSNGGTNASLTASNGGIFYSTGSAAAILLGTTTAGQILRSGASAAPSWSTATYPATAGTAGKVLISDGTNIVSSTPTYPNSATSTGAILRADGTNWSATTATYPNTTTANQILYSSATNTVGGLSSAANGVLVTDGSSVPSIGSTLPSAVQNNITAVNSGANTLSIGGGTKTFTSGAANIPTFSAVQTWTPGVSFGGGTTGITYTQQVGFYRTITYPNGTIEVAVWGILTLSNKGSSTGAARLTGLPVTTGANATANLVPFIPSGITVASGALPFFQLNNNSTTANIDTTNYNGGGFAVINDTNFANNSSIGFSFSYWNN